MAKSRQEDQGSPVLLVTAWLSKHRSHLDPYLIHATSGITEKDGRYFVTIAVPYHGYVYFAFWVDTKTREVTLTDEYR